MRTALPRVTDKCLPLEAYAGKAHGTHTQACIWELINTWLLFLSQQSRTGSEEQLRIPQLTFWGIWSRQMATSCVGKCQEEWLPWAQRVWRSPSAHYSSIPGEAQDRQWSTWDSLLSLTDFQQSAAAWAWHCVLPEPFCALHIFLA